MNRVSDLGIAGKINGRIKEERLQIVAKLLGFFKINSMTGILYNHQLGIPF